MPTYVVLAQFTDQGLRDISGFPARAKENGERAEKAGLKIVGAYLTMGDYDQVLIIDAPDEQRALTGLIGLLGQGNVRTKTLRAFTVEEVTSAMGPEGKVSVWSM